MTDFMNLMNNELNNRKTFTENGATAYATSGKELLDFYFATTALRQSDAESIKNAFTPVYYENPLYAVKALFQLRDCRGGNGERKIFRAGLVWLAENKPEICKAVVPLVAEYGRYDDLWCLLDTSVKDYVLKFVKIRLSLDRKLMNDRKPISLLAKWMCSENSSSKETIRYAGMIRSALGYTPRQYRKMLSRMRKYLDVVEVKMSARQWGEINYETVPSLANAKYSNAFMRNDEDRRSEYLDALKNGNVKINASVLQPHEIVRKYVDIRYFRNAVKGYDEALEQLWKAMPEIPIGNCLVVRDGSGSMLNGYGVGVRPIDVATGLAVRMAENNQGIWKDKYITFSSNPEIVDLSNCKNLRDKLVLSYKHDDYSNTNIEKTMMLILRTAMKNNCSQEDMPKTIIIISDMQFDHATSGRVDISLFDNIAQRFTDAGYQMPKICFWNVAGRVNNTIPMQKNKLGVVLISGFSTQIAKMVMSGKTDPYEILLEAINAQRYQAVEDAVKELV